MEPGQFRVTETETLFIAGLGDKLMRKLVKRFKKTG